MSTETEAKNDSKPVEVSPRSVDGVVAELDGFIDQLDTDGFRPWDIAVGLLVMSTIIAARYGIGVDCYERHRELLLESSEAFECAKCHQLKPNAVGAADSQPDVCDECYDTQKGAA